MSLTTAQKATLSSDTEICFAWALIAIESIALKHHAFFQTKDSLSTGLAINENSPNWNMYRLSLGRMSRIRVVPFTYWRATCEFPFAGIDYCNYVRAKLADIDPMTYNGAGGIHQHTRSRGSKNNSWNHNIYHAHAYGYQFYHLCFQASQGRVSYSGRQLRLLPYY